MLAIRAVIHKMHVRIANREDADQTASSEASLIWVCTICLDVFCNQLVFETLEHLLLCK